MAEESEWFVEAFGADYLDVYPHRDLGAAREEARFLVDHGVRGRVLDLCCGYGRHVLALRERGVSAFGIDLSADLLRHAAGMEGAAVLGGRLVRSDARRLPVRDASLDAVVSLFSSFGYFGDAGDRAVLLEVRRALRDGGLLVMDLMNPARVRATLVPESHASSPGMELDVRRSIASDGRHVVKDVRLTRPDGRVRGWQERVRMYERIEIERLLSKAGFDLASVRGDFDDSPHTAESPREILVAAKARAGPARSPL